MAEGDEDYSPAFPNSVLMARELTDRVEKVGTIEALIGSFALQQGFDPSFGRRGEPTTRPLPPSVLPSGGDNPAAPLPLWPN
jgi:hypothetical protein